jgi:capsular exopolysaccharide synthesis family protein
VALALFVAYVYLRYAKRMYRATGTLLIKSDKDRSNDKLEDILMSNQATNMQNEIEVLKSRPLMDRVVKNLNLQTNYYVIGRIREDNIYTQAPFRFEILELADSSRTFSIGVKFIDKNRFRIDNDQTFSFGNVFKNQHGVFRLVKMHEVPVGGEYKVERQSLYGVAGVLIGGLQVAPKIVGTGIITISLEGTHPVLCADVINELMLQYEQQTKERKSSAAEQTLSFIDVRLDTLGRELDNAQKKLLDYQVKNDLFDIENQSVGYLDNISGIDKSISAQQFNLIIASSLESYLSQKENEYDIVPTSYSLDDPTLTTLVEAYNTAQLERKQLLDAQIPKENLSLKRKSAEVENLRKSLMESVKNVKSFYNSNINELSKQNSVFLSRMKQMPLKIKEYFDLKREVENKLTLYSFLQARREETAISRASFTADSQVINKAVPFSTPIKPQRRTIQLLAILLGLGVPAMFIFIAEMLNDKITTRFDIEKITPVPILGEIGHSYSNKALVVNKTNRSMVAEQFRIIRSNLQYVLHKIEKPVILVTSSFSGEGKSFVTTNLGAVMALAGKKTIVLEFDIRKPKVLAGLGMTRRKGITNYLVGNATLEELIIPMEGNDNLFVMGCGPVPPNPAELLLDSRVNELFEWLKQHFDVILLDSAPVGMVSDALTLSKFCDCTLYLVRQGHTFKKQIGLIDEFYTDKKLPKVSIIINDVKIKPGFGYYGYGRYGYGYGYGYGSYYEEETPPDSFLERVLVFFSPRRWMRKLRGK